MFYSTMIKSTGSVCEQQLKKRKKSCFFTLKNVKKRKCVVSKSSYHPVPKVSTGKSPTSNILRTQETTQLRTISPHNHQEF